MSLLATLAFGAALQGAEPDIASPARVSCSPQEARWSLLDDSGTPDSRPARSSTFIWSCQASGRLLVVKSWVVIHGVGTTCHSQSQGVASAWLDGVKVISSEDFGEYSTCYAHGETTLLASLSVGPNGLEICRRAAREAEEPDPPVCASAQAEGQVDPAYRSPGRRSEARLRVVLADDPVCAQVTPRLRFARQGVDDSLDADAVAGAEGWGRHPASGDIRSARFDIDNDGGADEVRWNWLGLVWTASDGKTFRAPTLAFNPGGDGPADANSSTNQPVRLAGRIYVYLRRVPGEGGDGDYDLAMRGFGGPAGISRGLMALTPDGKGRLVCAWGPEARPEDAL